MSRIGKLPVVIPEGVTVTIADGIVAVKWPKGELSQSITPWVTVVQKENEVHVSIEDNQYKAFWGLMRALINNMVVWVTDGYEIKLQVIGVWYTAKTQGQKLLLGLWYSHPIEHELPPIITAVVDKDPKGNDMVILTSIDKQLVWEHAAKIRSYRKPEPYKWKWVRYFGEQIKMKAWKTATK